MKRIFSTSLALLPAVLAAVALNAACDDATSGGSPTLDASVAFDTSSSLDSGEDAAVETDSTTPVDAADAKVPPTCIDAGPLLDAGCYGALPLFNTGVDGTRTVLAGGSVDPHYALIQSAEATLPGPNAIVTSQIADGYWIPQSASSKWIAPSANQSYPGASPCNASGQYTYRTTFDLTGFDPATATISGQWAADNSGTAIRLNGASLGLTASSYNPFTPFTITSGFVAGMNSLEFEIGDIGCPNGLRVELSGYARYTE